MTSDPQASTTMSNHNQEPFANLSADDIDNQLSEIESLCMNCHEQGQTRLLLTRIPFYKEVILSSFTCPFCHFTNNDIQPANRFEPYGISITVYVQNAKDLNRQFVRSGYGSIAIAELGFEQPCNKESGTLTTIEGFLDSVIDNIMKTVKQVEQTIDGLNHDEQQTKENPKEHVTDSVNHDDSPEFEEQKTKLLAFVQRLTAMKNLEEKFHFELNDPSGNSCIENPFAPYRDDTTIIKKYKRTPEQNELLGIDESEIKQPDQQEITDEEILLFQTNCPSCNAPCDTNMKVTNIPHFKQVIIMATSCDYCGQRSNEVKSGTGISATGIRYRLTMTDISDLNRDILVSETALFSIPDIDFELSSASVGGRFTTIEGFITMIKTQLTNIIMPFSGGDSSNESSDKNKMKKFLNDIDQIISGTKFVTIVLDDPAGNCYVQNVYAPDVDPQLTLEHYERTHEENEMLGLNDIQTENYQNETAS